MKILLVLSLLSFNIFSQEIFKKVVLDKEDGGRIDGTAWSSEELKDKVYVIFYVDPDEKDLNEHVADLIKKQNFPTDKMTSIGIINMAATWLPNFAIASSLKEKQNKFPHTIYVKDFKKVLVKEWGLKDDSSNVLVFNKSGQVLIKILGKATPEEVEKVITLIRSNL
jgi:predicted transcriptional regulator